jgi:hypothetical protein
MSPLETEEYRKKGLDSLGRVVASFIGTGFESDTIDDTPLNQSDISGILRHLMRMQASEINNLYKYNKGYILGFDKPFTIHLINEDYGLVLIRRPDRLPWLLQLHQNIDPLNMSGDAVDRGIAAYLAMSSAWLEMKQINNGKR